MYIFIFWNLGTNLKWGLQIYLWLGVGEESLKSGAYSYLIILFYFKTIGKSGFRFVKISIN